jgi:hypothetical protein
MRPSVVTVAHVSQARRRRGDGSSGGGMRKV